MAKSGIVLNSVLDAIGNTPLIRLDRIAKHEGVRCNLRKSVHLLHARVLSQAQLCISREARIHFGRRFCER